MKKALIVTYYWPPAGGAGVQRALKFVKYLPQFGWEPVVLTVANPDSPVDDTSLLKDIPEGVKVYKTKSLEPFEIYKKFTGKESNSKIPGDVLVSKGNQSIKEKIANWIRLNIFIPDAKIGWKHYAVKEGLKIIDKENIDLIFTTSPPHTVQLIGKSLSAKSGLKWIADFRDPWMELIHYQANTRSKLPVYIESKIEKSVLNSADRIVTVSNELKNLFNKKANKLIVDVIPNGYDETDIEVDYEPSDKNDFIISYTGIISETKIPNALFFALSKFKKEGKNNFKIVFAGKICKECSDAIKAYGLSENYEFKGFLPHEDSVKLLLKSSILLLLIDDIPNNKGILTGKLFEYLGCKRPIFSIGPVGGDANEILINSDAGSMIDYNDNEGAYNLLNRMYENWKNEKSVYKFNVEQYSRRNLTKKLAEVFEQTI